MDSFLIIAALVGVEAVAIAPSAPAGNADWHGGAASPPPRHSRPAIHPTGIAGRRFARLR